MNSELVEDNFGKWLEVNGINLDYYTDLNKLKEAILVTMESEQFYAKIEIMDDIEDEAPDLMISREWFDSKRDELLEKIEQLPTPGNGKEME